MLQDLVTRFDRAPLRALLIANATFAAFVSVAHGGALALTFYKFTERADQIRTIAAVSLPLAVVVLGSSAVAYFKTHLAQRVLAAQALILFAAALALFGWAMSLALCGIPQRNFGWTPGLLSVIVSYFAYLFRRFWLSALVGRSTFVKHLHVFAFLATLIVELVVLVRITATFSRLFRFP